MHYYKRNIGDYAKKAGRLTMLQHGAYTLLMDSCYDREEFPTLEQAIDWCWASSKEEVEAVEFVLRKFFDESEDGRFIQKRIADALEEYQAFCNTQAEKGKKGGRPKKPNGLSEKPSGLNNKPNGKPSESTENPKPLTTNQEPLTTINNKELFDDFWNAGLPKTAKKKAELKFESILKGQKDKRAFTDQLIFDIQWRLQNNQFGFDKTHPTTYLNGERWNDERRVEQPGKPIGRKPSLAERSAEQTAIIQARIAAGDFDQRPVGQNGAVIPAQVEFGGRGEDQGRAIDAEFFDVVPQNGGINQ